MIPIADLQSALDAVQEAFRGVRPTILEHAGASAFTEKQDGSPVTEVDVAVERQLLAELTRRIPNVPFFGEESGYGELPPVCWLVDPIDGTKSFVAGVPNFTCMAVLIEHGEARACVIYNPSTDDMYVARKGRGATKNGAALDLSKAPLPPVGHCKERFATTLNAIVSGHGVTCGPGSSGAGYGHAMVAEGSVAMRCNLLAGGYVHDYAPAALVVREAGGVILPVADDEYSLHSRSFIACHPQLAAVLRPHLSELRQLEARLRDAA